MRHRIRIAVLAAFALSSFSACKAKEADPATPASADGRGRGGRGAASITLTAADVATVAVDTIEEATPVSGDLRPIETIEVRSRLEGDLIGVYVREGERVTANQLLARFESSEQESQVRSAEAELAAAETDLANAQWNAEQSAQLLRAGAISQRDHRASEQAVAVSKARLAAAEARVRSIGLSSRDTRVLAPAGGIIAVRRVESGERVGRGASLFSLVRNDVLELTAAVPARMVSAVRVGQTVHFFVDGRNFTGRVARVSPSIDPATRSGTIYVEIPNSSGALKSGAFATGRLVNRLLPGVITVPLQALRQSQTLEGSFVYRIEGNELGVAPVELGVTDERRGVVEVKGGLSAGDVVVVGNVGNLGRGMRVTVIGDERRLPAARGESR